MKNKKQSLIFYALFSIGTIILTALSILVIFEILIHFLPQELKYSSSSLALIAGLVLGGLAGRKLAGKIIKVMHLEEVLDENLVRLFVK